MSAKRFFVDGAHAAGDVVGLPERDARKIVRVLRLGAGDAIEAIDAAGRSFEARLEVEGERVRAALISERPPAGHPRLRVDLAQAVPKGAKMDFVIEKATELGAAAILPFSSERTVAHGVGEAKIERWRRLARSAAQQCERREVPEIEEPIPFEALLQRFQRYDAVLFAWEGAARTPAVRRLPELLAPAKTALAVVGPEGGFTPQEAQAAAAHGAHALWLGPRILRTETAGLVLLALAEAFGAATADNE